MRARFGDADCGLRENPDSSLFVLDLTFYELCWPIKSYSKWYSVSM